MAEDRDAHRVDELAQRVQVALEVPAHARVDRREDHQAVRGLRLHDRQPGLGDDGRGRPQRHPGRHAEHLRPAGADGGLLGEALPRRDRVRAGQQRLREPLLRRQGVLRDRPPGGQEQRLEQGHEGAGRRHAGERQGIVRCGADGAAEADRRGRPAAGRDAKRAAGSVGAVRHGDGADDGRAARGRQGQHLQGRRGRCCTRRG